RAEGLAARAVPMRPSVRAAAVAAVCARNVRRIIVTSMNGSRSERQQLAVTCLELAVLEDVRDPVLLLEHGDVPEGIAVDDEQVRELAGLQRAELALHRHQVGGVAGRRA